MIYLDNAASTRPAPEALEVMVRAAAEVYGNPSSAHALGAAAARALDEARGEVAALLRGERAEVVFTSGGTEADALGVIGAAGAARGRHLVVSGLEHPAVLRSAELLRARGHELTVVAPGKDGVVTAEAVLAAVRPDTAVVAVMLVNNELGTIQPVAEIAAGLRAAGGGAGRPHLHVDAVQAAGMVRIDVRALGADSLAISGHKLHGPRGAGALWVRPGARLAPLWDGGRQEKGLRSGTENLPACAGLGRAARLCREGGVEETGARVAALRDRLEAALIAAVPGARPTVAPPAGARAPQISSVLIPDLPAEPVLHALEARGVVASAGSACAARDRTRSHVLAAIGVDDRAAVLRFSLARHTTSEEIDAAAEAAREAVAEVRAAVTGVGRKARAR